MTVKWNGRVVNAAVRRALMRGLIGVGHDIANDAIKEITSGEKSGRLYTRRGIQHRASAPGEAPAADTGTLHNSIKVIPNYTMLRVTVQASTNYAKTLEYGNERIAPRPYLRPALYKHVRHLQARLSAEVAFTLRG